MRLNTYLIGFLSAPFVLFSSCAPVDGQGSTNNKKLDAEICGGTEPIISYSPRVFAGSITAKILHRLEPPCSYVFEDDDRFGTRHKDISYSSSQLREIYEASEHSSETAWVTDVRADLGVTCVFGDAGETIRSFEKIQLFTESQPNAPQATYSIATEIRSRGPGNYPTQTVRTLDGEIAYPEVVTDVEGKRKTNLIRKRTWGRTTTSVTWTPPPSSDVTGDGTSNTVYLPTAFVQNSTFGGLFDSSIETRIDSTFVASPCLPGDTRENCWQLDTLGKTESAQSPQLVFTSEASVQNASQGNLDTTEAPVDALVLNEFVCVERGELVGSHTPEAALMDTLGRIFDRSSLVSDPGFDANTGSKIVNLF